MEYKEFGLDKGKTLLLLPGTCCNYQTNFGAMLEQLASKYHLICVNYDGFDGTDTIFPDMITVTKKIEQYILEHHDGHIDGALGSSLGGSFVGLLIKRQQIHMDHGIFGSSDLDECSPFAAKLQTKIMYPLLISGAVKNSRKQAKMRKLMIRFFRMSEPVADKFLACFSSFRSESMLNEYYTDLITRLGEGIDVPNTQTHFIYANKMGRKYKKRYEMHFAHPDIREFNMQHEQWLFGDNGWTEPVLAAIDEFMTQDTPADIVQI